MPTNIIMDYTFKDRRVSNPDGTLAVTLPSAAPLVLGPGPVNSQDLKQVANFRSSPPLTVNISSYFIAGTTQFHARVVFRYVADPPSIWVPANMWPQHILGGHTIPFSMYLTAGIPRLAPSAKEAQVGGQTTEVWDTFEIVSGKWYTADLIWDKDTSSERETRHRASSNSRGQGPV
ncbi:uncharacterized protein PAC_19114 [Phialocephala subalpina]|uniref:Uncharacterized protein n=1 Tax=Phialocephala subalpina TaxID=576137 RepID=A0A1L7XVZ3_9HELO|nr:uncharacterized protein PAC_19114 [Phialocephala subalpina]